MEKEKLDEARKTFEEDKEKFDLYMKELNKKADDISNQVKDMMADKAKKIAEITTLQAKT